MSTEITAEEAWAKLKKCVHIEYYIGVHGLEALDEAMKPAPDPEPEPEPAKTKAKAKTSNG